MTTKPTKAVLYCRYSPRPDEAECRSIEKQVDHCKRYCNFHDLTVIGTFEDRGLSGRKMEKRPGLAKALKLACKRDVVLMAYSLSRLARNTRDALTIADRLQKAKAHLCLVREKVDTTTPHGKFFFTILAGICEFEAALTSERTSAAMRYYQRQGRRMSSNCPYGWIRDPEDPKMMIEHADEQAAIRRMVELREEGLSYRTLRKRLAFEGILNRNGSPWDPGRLCETVNKAIRRNRGQ